MRAINKHRGQKIDHQCNLLGANRNIVLDDHSSLSNYTEIIFIFLLPHENYMKCFALRLHLRILHYKRLSKRFG